MHNRFAIWFAALAWMVLGAGPAGSEPARYLRHPSWSPDHQTIAFSYRGDIWTVPGGGGTARRLTVHPARDQRPIWSPDGKWIAFASEREGQSDIFVMPSSGGTPRRLTFNSRDDFPCDWSPDGRFILAECYTLARPDLYEIPAEGGIPLPVTGLPLEGEYFARYSPDGNQIVFCDGGGYARWWWEGNRSARAGQVWILKRNSWPPQVERLSPEGTQFLWPGFSGRAVVATGNASRVANIVRLQPPPAEPRPLTAFSDEGVRWLRVSKDGSRAVFERDLRLWTIDLATDSVREVVVEAPSDWVVSPLVTESIDGRIESFDLSADGRRIAFVAGGEVYLMPAENPRKARRLTFTDARERFAIFSPDGRELAYVSDRNGRQNLYKVDTKSGTETALTQLSAEDVARPQYTPDGGAIAFYLGNDRIAKVPASGGQIDTVLIGRYFDFPLEATQEFRFSPDGRYLAYTAFGTDYNTDVWIYALDGSRNENVTRWSQYNYDPRWSPDGKYLAFTHSHLETRDLYALRLEKEPPRFAEARLDSLYEPAVPDERSKDTAGTAMVKIDFELAYRRWSRILPMAASQSEPVQTKDGKYWLFVADLPGGENIWKVPVDPEAEEKPEQLTSGGSKSSLAVAPDGKSVFYLERGRIGRVGIDGKEQKLLSFEADYDYQSDRRNRQKLTEIWRILGSYFYDRAMHGAAWDQQRERYAEALPHVALEEELHELFREFLGRLNASHLDVRSRETGRDRGSESGYLGLEFEPGALRRGRYRIAKIHAGGPLDRSDVQVRVGDTLVAVHDVALTARVRLDSLLLGTVGDRLPVTLRGAGGERRIAVKPVTAAEALDLYYEDWVAARRNAVDSLSRGRLGYLHIRAMNQAALDRFKRELADQTASYEGLVVDVRYNGGGWIAVHLLGMLERRPFVLRNFRGAPTVSENKSRGFAVEKPMILLINHFSASNAEIFAEGWRRLGLGKIVGYPTSAAVIGTAAYPLIDGSVCRRPSWGAYTVAMENLEGNGRQPDIHLFNSQHDWLSGRDPQLERAVTELLPDLR